jgi:ATP-dependent helicase/nuclease subunit A
VRVTEAGDVFRSHRVLAEPAGWRERELAEERFQAAEEVRLLYVAVTRAKEELVVARRSGGREESPWQALDPWLEERATVLELEPIEPRPRARVQLTGEAAQDRAAAAAERIERSARPSYRNVTVTDLAKDRVEPGSEEGSGDSGAPVAAAGGFRGFSWGSAVHGALAAAVSDPDPTGLRATCRDLLIENERPVDDHGEPLELSELLGLVAAVRASALWRRARRAGRMLSEVPFAVPGTIDTPHADDGDARSRAGRPQLDLFGEVGRDDGDGALAAPFESADHPVQVLEGVIDLAFLEEDGWVIADYKTDVGTDPDFARRRDGYRRQVDLYAEAWTRLTGATVKERVLFFTAQGRVERW